MKPFFIFWILLLTVSFQQENCVQGSTIPQQCGCKQTSPEFAFKGGPNFDYIKTLTEMKHAPNGICPNGYMFIAIPVYNNPKQNTYEICGNPAPSHSETTQLVIYPSRSPIICDCKFKTTTPKLYPNYPSVCYNCNNRNYKYHSTTPTIEINPKSITTTTPKLCPNYPATLCSCHYCKCIPTQITTANPCSIYPTVCCNCGHCNYKCQPTITTIITTTTKPLTTTTTKPLTTTTSKPYPKHLIVHCSCDICKCKLTPISTPKSCHNHPTVFCDCDFFNYKCQPTTTTPTTLTPKSLTTTTTKPCSNYPTVHCSCGYCKYKPIPILTPKLCLNYPTVCCNCDYCYYKHQPTTTTTTKTTPKPLTTTTPKPCPNYSRVYYECDYYKCKATAVHMLKPHPNDQKTCYNCDQCDYKCQSTTSITTIKTPKHFTKSTSILKHCSNYPTICCKCDYFNQKCQSTTTTTTETNLKPFTTTIMTTPKLCPNYSKVCCKCNYCKDNCKPTTTTSTTTVKPSTSKLYPFNCEPAYCKCNSTKTSTPKPTPSPNGTTPKRSINCNYIWCKSTTPGYKTATTITTLKSTVPPCITPSTCIPCLTTTTTTLLPVICPKYPTCPCTCNIPVPTISCAGNKDCKCKNCSQNIDTKILCCGRQYQNFPRVTVQLPQEKKEKDLTKPIAEKLQIDGLPKKIGGLVKEEPDLRAQKISAGEIKLSNTSSFLDLGLLSGFLPGKNLVDFLTTFNRWNNLSLDANALMNIFPRGIFLPFRNFSLGVTNPQSTITTSITREPCSTIKPTYTPVKECKCEIFPCTCNKISKDPCQCRTLICTCNRIPKESCQC